MNHWLLLAALYFIFSFHITAAGIKCAGGAPLVSITLPVPVNNNTFISGLAGLSGQYRELASWAQLLGSTNSAQCQPVGGTSAGVTHYVAYAEPYSGLSPVLYNNHYIFPTSVQGVGISFQDLGTVGAATNNLHVGSSSTPLRLEPTLNARTTHTYAAFPLKFRVRLWKIPVPSGVSGIPSSGRLTFTGPTIIVAQMNTSAADYYTSDSPNNGHYSLNNSWTISAFEIKGEMDINRGTCLIGDKTVAMGSHDVNAPAGVSVWKDASFTVQCPPALGYGVDYTLTSNTSVSKTSATKFKNSGLVISVLPLGGATVLNASQGIISLTGASTATGYGIQLAWGDVATLPATNSVPARAVHFMQEVDASTISDYVTKTYNIGETPSPQLIKMAARYIRTTGNASPGKANSAVEVIASYD